MTNREQAPLYHDTLAVLLENIARAEAGKGINEDLRKYFSERGWALRNANKITKTEHSDLMNRLYPVKR